MTIRPELLDELLTDFTKPEDLVGEGGMLKQLTKVWVERCLETEMEVHLDNPKYKSEKTARGERRNGHSQKTIKGEFGEATLTIPVAGNGEFEPVMLTTHAIESMNMCLRKVTRNQRSFANDKAALKGVDLTIENSLYAQTTRHPQRHRPFPNPLASLFDRLALTFKTIAHPSA